MTTQRDQLVEQALALPPEDRAYVADALEQSLTHEGFALPEIAAAWAAEIEQRLAAYDRGEVQADAADLALERIRRQFETYRSRRVTS
ncbi:MAG: addiction module protein [Planctomycetaceae bacterium]|nr:addiction module protein [Planctomycetaceae bacterium]